MPRRLDGRDGEQDNEHRTEEEIAVWFLRFKRKLSQALL
jgi:hypothetical protein